MTEADLAAEGAHTAVTDRKPNLKLNLLGWAVMACYYAHVPNWSCVVFTSTAQSRETEWRGQVGKNVTPIFVPLCGSVLCNRLALQKQIDKRQLNFYPCAVGRKETLV